jgi:hypothetical protein
MLMTGLVVAVLASAQPAHKDLSDLKPADETILVSYLKENAKPPEAYVIEKFKHHDVVILGETHENRDNLEFIAGLIAPLYHRAGVRCLATEFLRHKNTAKANQIVTAPDYQESAVADLYRDFGWIWGFKEYMDIFKAVWALNRSLPPGAERFRVVGLDVPVFMYELWSETDPERKKEIQRILADRDKFMADNLLREAFTSGGKVLHHTGFAHSYTQGPFAAGGERRKCVGGYMRDRLGDQVFQICLHQAQTRFAPGQPQAGAPVLHKFLEGLFEKNGNQPCGFDVAGSPFGGLTNRESPLFGSKGGGETFDQMTRGYVFLKPLAQIRRVNWMAGFVNAEYFDRFRLIALRRDWIKEDQGRTPAELDQVLKKLFGPRPPAPPLPKAVKLDPGVLEAYPGTYDSGKMAVTVTKDGDRLWLDAGRESKVELLPESATVFFWETSRGKRIVFSKNESGAVDRLILRDAEGELTFKRVVR